MIGLSSLFNKEKFKYKGVYCSLILFQISLCFFLNALFYTNDNISEIYYKGNLSHFHIFEKTSISSLIGFIVLKVLKRLNFFPIEFKTLFVEIHNMKYLNWFLNFVIRRIKNKLTSFFIIESVLLLFFWYYLSIFCIIYHNIQVLLVIDGVISISYLLILCIIYSSLFSLCRWIGVRCNIYCVYNISLFMNYIY